MRIAGQFYAQLIDVLEQRVAVLKLGNLGISLHGGSSLAEGHQFGKGESEFLFFPAEELDHGRPLLAGTT